MDRRAVLTGIAALVAGCGSEVGTHTPSRRRPSTTPTRTVGGGTDEAGRSTGTPAGPRGAFLAFLAANDVAVTSLSTDGTVARLEYVTRSREYDRLSAEIGTIAGGFLRAVEEGWDRERLAAAMLDAEKSTLATWHVEAEWGRQYRRGALTGEELSLKVLRTLSRPTGTESG